VSGVARGAKVTAAEFVRSPRALVAREAGRCFARAHSFEKNTHNGVFDFSTDDPWDRGYLNGARIQTYRCGLDLRCLARRMDP
jgi:hypothetical protein